MHLRNTYRLLYLLLLATLGISACKVQVSPLAPADKAFKEEKYHTALDLYRRISGGSYYDIKIRACFQTAECYRMMNDAANAVSWYEKAYRTGMDSAILFKRYGEALLNLGRTEEALEKLETYANMTKDSLPANICRRAIEWQKKELTYEVYNESGINSKGSDFSPAYFNDKIIFTSTREPVKGPNLYEWTGKGYLNMYVTAKNNRNRWEKPKAIDDAINSPFNEGVASYNAEKSVLYYTQCNGENGKKPDCKVYVSIFDGKTWSPGRRIRIAMDTLINFGNPSISRDGNTLYFTSDMPGGFGENDLYTTTLVDNQWTRPINLGPKINTKEDEDFPFIHPDGTLYFSSKGLEGMGGLDVFYCSYDSINKEFATPINLKYPTNSTFDDFGFILNEDKNEGYLSSNRAGGKGEDDIYSVIYNPPVFTLSGRAFHALTKKVLSQTNIQLLVSDGTTQKTVTDRTGYYKFDVSKDRNFFLIAQKNGFFGDNGVQSTQGLTESTDLTLNFYLTPIPKIIVLKGIFYDLDKADLRPESTQTLDSLVMTLNENPNLVIELSSHTDSRADSSYNQDLSQRRAQSVVDYLITKGIESDRLVAKGYGETKLVNKCADGAICTEEEHQANRRTEFAVLSENYVSKKQQFFDKTTNPQAPPINK